MFDCHIHSFFSGDSKMDAEKACEHAINIGLEGIAFTDHLDIDFPGLDDLFKIDFDRYDDYMDKLKIKYKDKLRVLKGIEVGLQTHTYLDTEKVVSKYDFDFCIASVHVVFGENPYEKGFYDNRSRGQVFTKYLELILHMVSNYNNFDVVGHFDYITRNSCYDDNMLRYDEFSDLYDEILKKIIEKGKGFEINTACYRNKPILPGKNFDIELLKKYREFGGDIICIGSDAHSYEHIGHKIKDINEILKDVGFKYTTHYEKRKPIYDKIK